MNSGEEILVWIQVVFYMYVFVCIIHGGFGLKSFGEKKKKPFASIELESAVFLFYFFNSKRRISNIRSSILHLLIRCLPDDLV